MFAIALQVGRGVEQLGVDRVGDERQQPVGAARRARAAPRGGGGRVAVPDVDVVLGRSRSSAANGSARVTKIRAIAAASSRLGLRGCSASRVRLSRSRRPRSRSSPSAGRAAAATKNGITPLVAEGRRLRPRRQGPTFRMKVKGPGAGVRPRLQDQEEGQGRRDLHEGDDPAGQEAQGQPSSPSRSSSTSPSSGSTPPAPTTGRRTASSARAASSDCKQEGPVVRFKVEVARRAGPHRLLGLAVRGLARAVLPAGLPRAPLARALRDAVRHRRGQRDLLPAGTPGGGRRTGCARRRRTSSSRSRRAAT